MEQEATSLANLLSDEPTETPIAEQPQEEPALPRDEHGRFAPKGDESGSPPPVEQKSEEPPLDHAALLGERKRRQEAEERARTIEAQLQALQNPPAPPPSIWEDDQGALNHLKDEAVSVAVQQATFNARLDMSEMMVRQANPDFEEVKAEFLALAEQNPTLRQQALADPHPWAKAYQIAKNHRTMQELGATSLDDLKAKIREELLSEMQAQPPARPGVPPTLSNERNLGVRSGPAWSGPSSLKDLLA